MPEKIRGVYYHGAAGCSSEEIFLEKLVGLTKSRVDILFQNVSYFLSANGECCSKCQGGCTHNGL